ncbi:MAG: ankyrin repeat domain-containing protein [Planctomycetota bacterium]
MYKSRYSAVRLSILVVALLCSVLGCVGKSNPQSESGSPTSNSSDTNAPNHGTSSSDGQAESQPDLAANKTAQSSKLVTPSISLMDAAMKDDLEAVKQHIAAGSDLNERAESGPTVLIAASTMGKTEAALLLIEAGADLELRDKDGATALHTAAFFCYIEITQALIDNGADLSVKNNAGFTALESVSGAFETVKPIYDLMKAVLGPLGLKLDYERLEETRPRIAEMLRMAS